MTVEMGDLGRTHQLRRPDGSTIPCQANYYNDGTLVLRIKCPDLQPEIPANVNFLFEVLESEKETA